MLCSILASCFQRAEQGQDDFGTAKVDYETLGIEKKVSEKKLVRRPQADTLAPDTVDHLHEGLLYYTVSDDAQEVDTVWYYPTGKKIKIGMHGHENLYLELGEFYDDLIYNGAKIYWGDSLIYATDLEVANDWQTCHVLPVDSSGITYVLLLMDNRPEPEFWHILCMNGDHIHLIDYVLAGNDYVEGGHYFHNNVIYEDLDGDGILEVGGKYWTELWADSMTYQPCRIYKLARELRLDEHLSEQETRKANRGLYLGLKGGLDVYNPNEEEHYGVEEDEAELTSSKK